MVKRTRGQTAFVPMNGVWVPIIGTVGKGGRVRLQDTAEARRLAGPGAWPSPANEPR